ncbi:MAG: hypothetical protein PHY94_02350 [Candidatus Omnitrophica bacterium]|nr:hypothetical protein [Candidatus Omnitrophota bacterium]
MEKSRKKKWGKPMLGILIRGKGDDMVMAVCKAMAAVGGPPGGFHLTHGPCANYYNATSCFICLDGALS